MDRRADQYVDSHSIRIVKYSHQPGNFLKNSYTFSINKLTWNISFLRQLFLWVLIEFKVYMFYDDFRLYRMLPCLKV